MLERPFQTVEHVVEGHSEQLDLVVRGWDGEALSWGLGGYGGRTTPHCLDRTECRRGEPVTGEYGEEKRGGCRKEEFPRYASQGFHSRGQRVADDHRGRLVVDDRGSFDHAPVTAEPRNAGGERRSGA